MKRSKQWVVIAIVLPVLGMGVGSVSWWRLGRRAHSDDEQGTLEQASSQPYVRSTTGESSRASPAPAPPIIDSVVEQERKRTSTAESSIEKRFVPISTPRRDILRFVTSRSLEEVARDLGDFWIMELCRDPNVYGTGSGMLFWATAVPPNIMVLRLIEEGREDPDRVSDILTKAIAKKIEKLAEVCKNQKNPPTGKPYDIHREAVSTRFSIAGAFYVLANIDRLKNPAVLDLLERWIAAPKPRGYESAGIEIWVIDYYFRLTDAPGNRHAAAHLAIANDRVPAGPKRVFSKWNQPWDVNDWRLHAVGVNVKDFETIEVLTIPGKVALTFDDVIRIRENFRQHVKQLRSADGPTPKGP